MSWGYGRGKEEGRERTKSLHTRPFICSLDASPCSSSTYFLPFRKGLRPPECYPYVALNGEIPSTRSSETHRISQFSFSSSGPSLSVTFLCVFARCYFCFCEFWALCLLVHSSATSSVRGSLTLLRQSCVSMDYCSNLYLFLFLHTIVLDDKN